MNNNYSIHRPVAVRITSRQIAPAAVWAITAACLTLTLAAGCQLPGHAVHHQPAFEQLEQGCFGYEPTVWRSMAGDCQQAVRMVTEEGVNPPEPPAAKRPKPRIAPPPPAAEPEVAEPEEATMEDVPDRGPLDVPRIVAPPEPQNAEPEPAEPATPTKPPAVSPSEVPDVPQTVVPPAEANPPVEKVDKVPAGAEQEPAAASDDEASWQAVPALPLQPQEVLLPQVEQSQPSVMNTPVTNSAPASAERPQLPPVIDGPVAQTSSARASATALFRTVSQALDATAPPAARIAKQKPAAAGLSRFISY